MTTVHALCSLRLLTTCSPLVRCCRPLSHNVYQKQSWYWSKYAFVHRKTFGTGFEQAPLMQQLEHSYQQARSAAEEGNYDSTVLLHFELNSLIGAITYYRQSLKAGQTILGSTNHPSFSRTLLELANVYLAQGLNTLHFQS